MTEYNIPTEWADADQIDGLDLVAKDDLVGVPFRIFSVWTHTNKDGVRFMNVNAEYANRETFAFNDTSTTGVRAQLLDYLAKIGKDGGSDGDVIEISLVARRGLRVSNYVQKDARGRDRAAKTFYLTTSGQAPQGTGVAAPATRPKAAKATPKAA